MMIETLLINLQPHEGRKDFPMKYDTIEDINLLYSLIAEKKGQLNFIMKELSRLQNQLHSCETLEDVERVASELKELTAEADERLKFITKAKKRIAKFFAPAA